MRAHMMLRQARNGALLAVRLVFGQIIPLTIVLSAAI
jgi:hypothetical protein